MNHISDRENAVAAAKAIRNCSKKIRSQYEALFNEPCPSPSLQSSVKDFDGVLSAFTNALDASTASQRARASEFLDDLLLEQSDDTDGRVVRKKLIDINSDEHIDLDDIAPNLLMGEIEDAILDHLGSDYEVGDIDPLPLDHLLRQVFKSLHTKKAISKKINAGSNRHIYPMQRWLKEMEYFPIGATTISYRIGRMSPGGMSHTLIPPSIYCLRFLEL